MKITKSKLTQIIKEELMFPKKERLLVHTTQKQGPRSKQRLSVSAETLEKPLTIGLILILTT